MSEQEKKPRNKKLLTYYLILAACLILIAAITVGVIFAVRGNSSGNNITIDSGNEQTDGSGNNSGNDGEDDGGQTDSDGSGEDDNDGGDVQDTTTSTVFILPVASTASATNSYGFYYNSTLDRYYLHEGIDFTAQSGTEVYAAIDGTVESITTGDILKGTTITLSHTGGITTVYTFVEAAEGLKVGDSVSRGDVIATVADATGEEYKEGSHLHFEVYVNGSAVDPEQYLEIESK